MFSLEIECAPDERDFLIAELWEQGSAGIAELNPRTVRAFFDDGARRTRATADATGSICHDDDEIFERSDEPHLFSLANQLWHTDSSFKTTPARYSMLSCREATATGGDMELQVQVIDMY